ncbi:autotransporter outer membrane beta-barrel domain-containing protein [Catenovulum sp. SM1970]|uniref:autotransporter outer membrane beta-barrel domain-containing protein n=1 Tax=Marinifaba aquimaris TaxID=2741323 RepID=UPI0015741133|nr:autotransporter outer membrane beta-barrel domain-containing protein [Marinifaba aquimaris]NTS76688.1 autotransporter outer membrane beta-barrel domain-containing protein [Marinifaba aquimaris]
MSKKTQLAKRAKSVSHLSTSLSAAALAMAVATPAMATDVHISSGLGYDDNPYRLNEAFKPESDTYWRNKVRIKHDFNKNWYTDARLDSSVYADDSNADTLSTHIEAGYKTRLLDNKATLTTSLAHKYFDKTFVSRFSGQEYFYKGNNASDRYDYQRWTPEIDLTYRLDKNNRFKASFDYRFQAYEGYTDLGLSNLDYEQAKLKFEWRHRFNKNFSITPNIELTKRSHDERLAKDALGKNIPGKVLSYDYQGAGVKSFYRFNKATSLSTSFKYIQRNDNASGYYDTEEKVFSTRLLHKFDKNTRLTLGLRYADLDYQRQLFTDVETEDETPSTEGWRVQAKYQQHAFSVKDVPVSWYADANYYDYTAEINAYEYDRVKLESGLSFKF